MMAFERSESTQDNFGRFIDQFQPETKTLIKKLVKIFKKLYRQNVSLLLNQTCFNERLLPNYIYIYIYGENLSQLSGAVEYDDRVSAER